MVGESISLRHVFLTNVIKKPSSELNQRRRILRRDLRFRRGVIRSKTSDFLDYRNYARPLRLLPVEEVKSINGNSSVDASGYRTFYKVKIQTSVMSGSGLSEDMNARVLVCIIDEKGNSVLQTVPANVSNDSFQRGSVDEITFQGPKLGEIKALWIGIETGQWRLGGVTLWMIHVNGDPDEEETSSYRYDFEFDDVLLGESIDLSMVELRPARINELIGSDPLRDQSPSSSLPDGIRLNTSNEQSMKEYADLKFSLLLYDSILVLLGTIGFSFSIGENSGIAFFVGGIVGYLYLLLLQKSVDELRVPESSLTEDAKEKLDGKFKIPAVSVAVVAGGLSVLAVKGVVSGDSIEFALTPKEVIVGTLGFLMCKLAVVLAAIKPSSSPLGTQDKN